MMKSLFTLLLCFAITIAINTQASAQCNTGYCYVYPYQNTAMQGDQVGLQSWYSSNYKSFPDATYWVALSSDNGSTWMKITQFNARDNKIGSTYNSYYYEYHNGSNYGYFYGYQYLWTVPKTVPAGKYRISMVEVPNNKGDCAMAVTQNYYDFTVTRGCFQPSVSTIADISACQGQAVTISPDATKDPGYILYEWYKDGKALTITKTPTLTFDPVTTANAGKYYVIVSDLCGKSIQSNTFNVSVLTPGIITQEPVGKTVCEGNSYTVSVTASGSPLRYQWYKNGQVWAGQTGSSFTINSATQANEGEYQVIVTGGCGEPDTSQKITIAVPAKPVFNEPIQGGWFCRGEKVVIAPNVTGTILAYQWYYGDVRLVGKTSRNLTIDAIQARDNGNYWVEVSVPGSEQSGCPAITKSNRVFVGAYEAPVIKKQPASLDVCAGSDQRLTVEADGTDLTYQWFVNGTAIPNSNNFNLPLNGIKPGQAGDYSVIITGACGYFSESAKGTVHVYNKPTITQQPMSTSARVGEQVTLGIVATEAQEIIWMRDEHEVSRGTSSTFVIAKATMNDAGFYRAVVKNACDGETSNSVYVTIIDPESLIPTIAISSNSVDVGDAPFSYPISFTATGLVVNAGNVPITVSGYSITGANASEFSVSSPGVPYTLAAGQSHDVTISYTPASVGASTATLNIQSDATAGNSSATLTGRGVVLYSTDQTLDYGTVDKLQATIKCINITNTSGKDITIDAITVNGTFSDEFTVTTALPLVVPAGAVKELCVQFTPTTVGDRNVSLAIMSSTGGNTTVNAIGVCAVASSVTEDALAAGMSVYPNPSSSSVTINTGKLEQATLTIVNSQGAIVATMSTTGGVANWNLQSANGSPVASGTYIILVADKTGSNYRMTLSVTR